MFVRIIQIERKNNRTGDSTDNDLHRNGRHINVDLHEQVHVVRYIRIHTGRKHDIPPVNRLYHYDGRLMFRRTSIVNAAPTHEGTYTGKRDLTVLITRILKFIAHTQDNSGTYNDRRISLYTNRFPKSARGDT